MGAYHLPPWEGAGFPVAEFSNPTITGFTRNADGDVYAKNKNSGFMRDIEAKTSRTDNPVKDAISTLADAGNPGLGKLPENRAGGILAGNFVHGRITKKTNWGPYRRVAAGFC